MAQEGTLFTFLDPELIAQTHENLTSPTNALKGGINAQIKNLVRYHRGLSEDHMKRAVEWWCYLHSPNPQDPISLLCQTDLKLHKKQETIEPETGPAHINTGINLTHTDYLPGISTRKRHIG